MRRSISAKILQDEYNKEERKEVWLKAWCSMATNSDITSFSVCTKAADECLAAYDERFGK